MGFFNQLAKGFANLGGSIPSMVVGGLSDVLNRGHQEKRQDAQNDMMMRFQAEQNQKNNEFNAREAEKQRQYERTMSNSAIQRQVADYRAAGFNPALIGAGGNITGASTPSGATASASPSSSPNMQTQVAQKVDPLTASQIALNNAQAKNLESNTNKTDNETQWMDALNSTKIGLDTSAMRLNISNANLSDAQKRLAVDYLKTQEKQREVMDEQINEIRDKCANMEQEWITMSIRNTMESERCRAEIDNIVANSELSREQARDLVETRLARIANLDADTRNKNQQTENLILQGGLLAIDYETGKITLDIAEANKEFDIFMHKANSIIDAFGNIVGTFYDAVNIKNAIKGSMRSDRAQEEYERHNRANETEINRHNRVTESQTDTKMRNENSYHRDENKYRDAHNQREQEKHDSYKYGLWYDPDGWTKGNKGKDNPLMRRFRR